MRAEYDSEADALDIRLVDAPVARSIEFGCRVVAGPGPRFGLDVVALTAAAAAAVAAPGRVVAIEVRPRVDG